MIFVGGNRVDGWPLTWPATQRSDLPLHLRPGWSGSSALECASSAGDVVGCRCIGRPDEPSICGRTASWPPLFLAVVLQPYLVELESSLVVGCFGAVLVSASPSRPSMNVVEGANGGDQVCQQTADLAEGEGNEAVLGFSAPSWRGRR